MEEKMMEGGKCDSGCCGEGMRGCKCMHHMAKPLLIVLLGATVAAWGLGYLEPEMTALVAGGTVVLMGMMKMFARMCKCC